MGRAIAYFKLKTPGAIFIITGLLYYLFIPKRTQLNFSYLHDCKTTIQIILKPVLTILLLVCYAQIIRPDLAKIAQIHLQGSNDMNLFINPLLGIFGSF